MCLIVSGFLRCCHGGWTYRERVCGAEDGHGWLGRLDRSDTRRLLLDVRSARSNSGAGPLPGIAVGVG